MLSRALVPFSVAALLVCTMSNSVCQTSKTAIKALPVRPFDIAVDRLPPAFTGNSISAIFQAVARRPDLHKSEFETADQYQDRITALTQSKLLGDLQLNGTVAFVIACDSSSEPDKECDSYDAETQMLDVLLPHDSVDYSYGGRQIEAQSEARYKVTIHSQPVSSSIQIREEAGPRIPIGMAQNGFGAKFPISRQSITRYFVETTVPDWFNRPASEVSGSLDPQIKLNMDPQTAMHAKGAVRELIVGHISAPFLSDTAPFFGDSHVVNEATTSYPIRSDVYIRTVHMDIDAVWFFNARTGQVYLKIRPDHVMEGSAHSPTDCSPGQPVCH
jgi:hypothetical protein